MSNASVGWNALTGSSSNPRSTTSVASGVGLKPPLPPMSNASVGWNAFSSAKTEPQKKEDTSTIGNIFFILLFPPENLNSNSNIYI